MTANARKSAAAAVPVVSEVSVGADLHTFTVDGVVVHVRAVRADRLVAAAELIARLHAVCSIPAAAPRSEAWGPGQFDDIEIGPGVRVALRITKDGRVLFYAPPGPLDITAASSSLGTGMHEAGARAAQIRVRRENRTAGRAASKLRAGDRAAARRSR